MNNYVPASSCRVHTDCHASRLWPCQKPLMRLTRDSRSHALNPTQCHVCVESTRTSVAGPLPGTVDSAGTTRPQPAASSQSCNLAGHAAPRPVLEPVQLPAAACIPVTERAALPITRTMATDAHVLAGPPEGSEAPAPHCTRRRCRHPWVQRTPPTTCTETHSQIPGWRLRLPRDRRRPRCLLRGALRATCPKP